jgi:uncharacterized damage-inducible protein DinB
MNDQPESLLVELIRCNNWANAQVFAACTQLTPEQAAASTPGSYGSIHRTLGHLIHAESDYINRLTGSRPEPAFRWEDKPSIAQLAAYAEQVGAALLETVQRVPPDQMVHEEEDGNTMEYRAQLLFIQVINHGIEHRTNITTILNGLGLPAPEVDGWGYLFAHPETFALKETFKDQPDAGA